jgi:hypothetical protein
VPDGPALVPTDEHLDEGDILSAVPFIRWKDGKPEIKPNVRGVITSHGCACEDYERAVAKGQKDKAGKMMLQIAPLRDIKGIPAHRLDEIKAGKQLDYFYIYGEGGTLNDHIVDLTHEQPIPASMLNDCRKVARLAPWQFKNLLIHLTVSRFHQPPEEIFRDDLLDEHQEETDAA